MNRRDFVKKTGAAAAMIAVAPSVAVEEIPAQPEFTYESFCEFAEAVFNYKPVNKIAYLNKYQMEIVKRIEDGSLTHSTSQQ